MLLSAAEEVIYTVQPMAKDASTESATWFRTQPHPHDVALRKVSGESDPPPPPSLHHLPPSPRQPSLSQHAAGLSRTQAESLWQNVDLSAWTFSENPFQRVYADLDNLQLQYHRLEHITRGANHALNDCGPGNILRSWLTGRTGRSLTKRGRSSTKSRQKMHTSTRRCPPWLRS